MKQESSNVRLLCRQVGRPCAVLSAVNWAVTWSPRGRHEGVTVWAIGSSSLLAGSESYQLQASGCLFVALYQLCVSGSAPRLLLQALHCKQTCVLLQVESAFRAVQQRILRKRMGILLFWLEVWRKVSDNFEYNLLQVMTWSHTPVIHVSFFFVFVLIFSAVGFDTLKFQYSSAFPKDLFPFILGTSVATDILIDPLPKKTSRCQTLISIVNCHSFAIVNLF